MTTRETAPAGSPCWADLWTSDVAGSRSFYPELLGWEALEPSEEFGGYFMFNRNGVPVAGGMGPMGDMAPSNAWRIYLTSSDINKTAELVEANGGEIVVPPMAVADLGHQLVFNDATGAHLGAWQPESFAGFTVLGEHGAPSWFELHTRDHDKAIEFYRSVFSWETKAVGDSDEFRYTTMLDPSGEGELAGVMDAANFLPDGEPSTWSVYWAVEDAAATVARAKELGGSVVHEAEDTPYGRLATVADPAGAVFKLRTSS